MQLINVFFGGTLVPDLPSLGKTVHNEKGKEETFHKVIISENSQLYKTIQVTNGEINSSHHQSVDSLGKGFNIAAVSTDGVIESIENSSLPFITLVQRHPERLPIESVFSLNLRRHIVELASKYSLSK